MAGKKSRKQAKAHNRFNADRAIRLYKKGKFVSDIAVAMGYERGHGQNRVRTALMSAGVYKPVRDTLKATPVAAKGKGNVTEMTPVSGPDNALRECLAVVESRYNKLHGRARSGWLEKLAGAVVARAGATKPVKIAPVSLGKAA